MQGKPFTKEQRETIIETLLPHLEMGLSRTKACAFIGFDHTTLSKWVKEDEALSMKLTSHENAMNIIALSNVHQALQNENEALGKGTETKAENTWKFLNVKEDSFKLKQDVTSDGESLNIMFDSSLKGE